MMEMMETAIQTANLIQLAAQNTCCLNLKRISIFHLVTRSLMFIVLQPKVDKICTFLFLFLFLFASDKCCERTEMSPGVQAQKKTSK